MKTNSNQNRKNLINSFAPPADKETFKDLLIFEERLKQNAARLQRQRLKYEAFLVTIIIVTIILGYRSLRVKSEYQIVHYLNVGLLLVSITTLILFFATGMYTDKILYAYKFIPQTNRALRPFNMFLNTSPALINSLLTFLSSPRSFFNNNQSSSNDMNNKNSNNTFKPRLINPRGELLFSSKVSPEFIDRYEAYRTQWERRQKQ